MEVSRGCGGGGQAEHPMLRLGGEIRSGLAERGGRDLKGEGMAGARPD